MIPKPISHRDPAYLDYIRSLSCANCGRFPSEAAHMRCLGGGGMGKKPSDYHAIPLCPGCHRLEHTMGVKVLDIDPARVALNCAATYIWERINEA